MWGNPINLIDPRGLEVTMTCRPIPDVEKLLKGMKKIVHCALFVWHRDKCGNKVIDSQHDKVH
jgi:hypothetical protein